MNKIYAAAEVFHVMVAIVILLLRIVASGQALLVVIRRTIVSAQLYPGNVVF